MSSGGFLDVGFLELRQGNKRGWFYSQPNEIPMMLLYNTGSSEM